MIFDTKHCLGGFFDLRISLLIFFIQCLFVLVFQFKLFFPLLSTIGHLFLNLWPSIVFKQHTVFYLILLLPGYIDFNLI